VVSIAAAALVAGVTTPASATWAESSASVPGCTLWAGIERVNDTSYRIRGSASCNTGANLRIWCFPVHRHSLSWHSHTDQQIADGPRFATSIVVGPATFGGTNGDTYKTNCKLERNGSVLLSVESPSVNL
jgi:hypothetical protein